jgi:hypothetical protein
MRQPADWCALGRQRLPALGPGELPQACRRHGLAGRAPMIESSYLLGGAMVA